jgi:hypothetical protein
MLHPARSIVYTAPPMGSNGGVYRIARSAQRGWKLRRDGAARSLGTYPTRDAAIERGRPLAAAANVDLLIHTDTGTIRIRPRPIRWPVRR